MNPDRTITLLRQRFGAVEQTAERLFRAERRNQNNPLGVFYFDFSDRILAPEFDLQRYSHEHIASDFYRHEGSVQWNYYLYFDRLQGGCHHSARSGPQQVPGPAAARCCAPRTQQRRAGKIPPRRGQTPGPSHGRAGPAR